MFTDVSFEHANILPGTVTARLRRVVRTVVPRVLRVDNMRAFASCQAINFAVPGVRLIPLRTEATYRAAPIRLVLIASAAKLAVRLF